MLSFYVHIPFCADKCRYCGFYSTRYNPQLAELFLKAAEQEIIMRPEVIGQRIFGSIYVGGGTPTVLSVEQMEILLTGIREQVMLADSFEFTVEANPNSISPRMLSMLKTQAVNRISIGVQSFHEEILRWLGRGHTATEAKHAVAEARKWGFENISIDLIFGVPGLTEQIWHATLREAIELCPAHISAYSLSVDDGAKLCREQREGTVDLPDEALVAQQYETAVLMLADAGYQQYEISNFSKPSFECRHNLNYWDRGEYVGIGPGAWSFRGNRRSRNIAAVDAYVERLGQNRLPVDFDETLEKSQAAEEALFLGLRKTAGIDLSEFAAEHGAPVAERIIRQVESLLKTGLFFFEKGRLRLSRRGMLLSTEALSLIAV